MGFDLACQEEGRAPATPEAISTHDHDGEGSGEERDKSTVAPAPWNSWEGPPKDGLYDPANEKDACGVGFIVSIEGKASHKVRADIYAIF